MNPLATRTFYSRHKRHTALLLSLSIIITFALYAMVALVWGLLVEPGRQAYMAYSEFSLVTPALTAEGPDAAVLDRLESNPDIARVIPSTFIRTELPGLMAGQDFQFDLLGLREDDMPYLLQRLAAMIKDGRLPQPGTAELLLSADVAKMLALQVGDSYVVTSSEFYAGMDGLPEPTTFELVGILESDVELGIVSLEFLRQHEQYRQLPARLLVVAHEGHEEGVENFLRIEISGVGTGVMTQEILNERIVNEALPGLVMLLPVILIMVIAFSLLVVTINQLANARRLPEFGLLHATGRSKRWLVRRLTRETTTLALVGWIFGVGLSSLTLYLLKVTVFAARGHDLDYVAWLPIALSFFMPAAIAGTTYLAVRRTLTRLDAVDIVERRELSQEANRRRPHKVVASAVRPLAAATFYRRHRRRAVLLVSGMTLMILAIVLFIFALAVDTDAKKPFLGYLNRVSIVRSAGVVHSLDPEVVIQIVAHPTVARVIPIAPRYSMLNVTIPPFESAEANPFAVYAEDMAYLVDLYGLTLKDGRLPHPGANEMVIPAALAQNRDLKVGDVVGDPAHPVYPGAPSLDNTFVVVGIFAPPATPTDGSGLGFISLEYLERLNTYDIPEVPPLLVVPKVGEKDALDAWLERDLASANLSIVTRRQEISRLQSKARQDIVSIAILEGVVAVVAAVGLTVLNYIFTSQRHAEFGVLHALGYSRHQLVRRVLSETAYTTGIAWGSSALIGLASMLLVRTVMFAPLGLTLNMLNLTPWLYTLPIPVAVLAVTGFTTARALADLDPITLIDRRLA